MWSYNREHDSIDVGGHDFARTKKYRDVERSGRAALVVDDLASTDPWRPRGIERGGHQRAQASDPHSSRADRFLNGTLSRFGEMRYDLLGHIRPDIARRIEGTTDSEWVYALLLSQLCDPAAPSTPEELERATETALRILREIRGRHGVDKESDINLVVLRCEQLRGAMLTVAREDFVPPDYRDRAYEEVPLPLPGERATFSCPHSNPLFYEPLGLAEGHRFLEVAVRSGYSTALAREVVGREGLVVAIDLHAGELCEWYEHGEYMLEKVTRNVALVPALRPRWSFQRLAQRRRGRNRSRPARARRSPPARASRGRGRARVRDLALARQSSTAVPIRDHRTDGGSGPRRMATVRLRDWLTPALSSPRAVA
jgi:hypothetical protein